LTTYKYKGISKSGEHITGVIEAYSESEAAFKLRDKCSVINNITEVGSVVAKAQLGIASIGKISTKSLAILCSQFSVILKSGLPIVRCVEIVEVQTTDKNLKAILHDVAEDVSNGYSLAQSFDIHKKYLPTVFIESIRAGEESGTLEVSFDRLTKYFEKSSMTKDKLKSALTYPVIVLIVAVIVAAIIMIKAVPMFKSTFESMGVELPGVTKALISLSDFFVHSWNILLIVIIVLLIGLRLFKGTTKGSEWSGARKLKRSLFRKVYTMDSASQFASTMSTMLYSGLTILRALDITSNVLNNYVLSKAVKSVVTGVEQGKSVAVCMKETGVFPDLLVEMTGVGEETGKMEETLEVISNYYDNEVSVTTGRLMTILEPVITVLLAVVTVFLLLSIYLPMFSMYGGM